MTHSSSPSRPCTPVKLEDTPSRPGTPVKLEDSPATTPEPTLPARKLSAEASDIVSQWDNFIPLGCLCFSEDPEDTHSQALGSWSDIYHLPESGDTLSHLSRLLEHGWIRLQVAHRPSDRGPLLIFRIYTLRSDVGQICIDRSRRHLRSALQAVIREIDVSPETWTGEYDSDTECAFDPRATRDQDDPSLFYAFNKIPSPSPSAIEVEDKYGREALSDLLHFAPFGLETNLYPYQRRSAGEMLRRELVPRSIVDPRFERRAAPDGSFYYFNAREIQFVRMPANFEICRGGILAETMGNGKTLMCLALILATKNLPPRIPVNYSWPHPRPSVGSLAEMAASALNQNSFPWKVELDRIQQATGTTMTGCYQRLSNNPGIYDVPITPYRFNRTTRTPPPHRLTLANTTLIVVPRNLCNQWQSEITKHVEAGALKVLIMDDRNKELPSPDELRSYDIVLFTRNLFDRENKHGEDAQGRKLHKAPLKCRCSYKGSGRERDCTCLREDMLYDSPLKHLHFKRLVIDEGHFFSSSRTNTALVARKLVTADHRWIVSGTPAQDLLGAEVHLSAKSDANPHETIEGLIAQQRFFSERDKAGAIDSLGSLITNFLEVEPWVSNGAAWKDYIFCHDDRKHTFSGFSTCLQKTLHNVVVKTRAEDVERDIELPPLHHATVRLEPSFYDKITANLFVLVLTANSVTSERVDADFLFHKNSAQARARLVTNLRQSAFFWTGFSESDIEASLRVGRGYLRKEGTNCTEDDRKLLSEALACAESVLGSKGWRSMSRSQELGMFVENWPEDCAEHWTFDGSTQPLMTGITQLAQAQKFVDGRLDEEDPGEGLAGAGIKALVSTRAVQAPSKPKVKSTKPTVTKSGVPASSIESFDARSKSRRPSSRSRPQKKEPKAAKTVPDAHTQNSTNSPSNSRLTTDSRYAPTTIVGTASAKMSYLVSQILKFQREEKILVFYQGDHIAYYLSQVLDLVQVEHEIYAKSLDAKRKSEYVVNFNNEDSPIRVLLMDVRQAAYGLNLCCASRIYFVNPVCRPNDEAQAIKRAHRIGQTRPVFVETLVLKGSMEEKMFERSKRMTNDEHREAKTLEDDYQIREIIQSARILPLKEEEMSVRGQMAPIEKPEPLWDRAGRRNYAGQCETGKRKRDIVLKDATDAEQEGRIILEDEDGIGLPLAKRRATMHSA
ncbi:hypothetical protein D0869_01683 [Lecanosticta acicola]|uniref:Helicase C-terminal domain-containing protein n=1 Tax=Lecanosticta acicola TaxID=111012 RepID=A0AAI8Z8E0_9PEZI|nr:hypothetical protein D0869_01683 [Lecanosticta acicola]